MSTPALSQGKSNIINNEYDARITQLWNYQKEKYYEMIQKSDTAPYNLYIIQAETNNLLKYAGYRQKYVLLDELCALYLQAIYTMTETDQYVYYYYPGSDRRSVHSLGKKYRMWITDAKPNGEESILVSSQYLYLLSDTVTAIVDIRKEKRTKRMNDVLSIFIPILVEHYDRWIFKEPGPFQVRGWGCQFDGKPVPACMSHLKFINSKLRKKLGNGKSSSYCNAVTDMDMWIIAGVANLLNVYNKDKFLVPITEAKYKDLVNYVKTGALLFESRFSPTKLKNFDNVLVEGTVFDAGAWDDHKDFSYTGYRGQDYPRPSSQSHLKHSAKNIGWDLSHASRFVHVFDSLFKAKDILGLNFPTKEHLKKMSNQLVYATFNKDFKKPLFTNFMDGTNGWYRIGYSGRSGFGYGPWDMSYAVPTGGYGFWSIYNNDIQTVFVCLADMMKTNDPEIRRHVAEHYEKRHWNQYTRVKSSDFKKMEDSETRSMLIKFLPSMCFMKMNINGL